MNDGLKTPILFLIFNRPETTSKVFEAIRDARPRYLFVAADGPRKTEPFDKENSNTTRAIINLVDWPCEVKTLYREDNLGCRVAVSSAISWFFSQVEEGIVLEDDCLPHPDFFPFCETLLEKYRDEPSVMHITGGNYQRGIHRGEPNASYYFSRTPHVWGWASWKRAWKQYDVDMNDYPEFLKANKKNSFFADKKAEKYWLFHFGRMYRKSNTWDYQWTYAVMKNHGYCIIPNINLISNIGFGGDATHTTSNDHPLANMKTYPLKEIIHPKHISYSEEADHYSITIAFPTPGFTTRAINKIIRELKGLRKKLNKSS